MFTHSGVNGEYYFHYDNLGNTVLLTDEDGVPQYTALYDISNGKRVQEWNPNSLDFAIKSEGQEEKISYEISDIQLTLHYELTVRKYSAIAIIGNKDWIDLTVSNWRGGSLINPCFMILCDDNEMLLCTCTYTCYEVTTTVDENTGIITVKYTIKSQTTEQEVGGCTRKPNQDGLDCRYRAECECKPKSTPF
ncbi:hypothetical protein LLG10_08215 [bacterium]|nr:hypothetical protein [bacterium]